MKLFDAIVNAVTAHDVSFEVQEHELEIMNYNNSNKLYVYEEEYFSQDMKDRFVQYIVAFSTQHRHFDADEEDEVLEYILAILNDEVLPLEFYKDGKRRFGGEIEVEELERLSVSSLSKYYGYTSDYLLSFDYEIHSWSGKYDTGLRKISDLKP